MGTSEGYAILLGTILVAVCTAVLMLVRSGVKSRGAADTAAVPAESAVQDFCQQVNLLRKEREVLDAHLNDYFQTFHEAGWPNLLKLLLRLGQAESQLKQMLAEERYADALQFANLLLGRVRQEDLPAAQAKFPAISILAGWKAEADKIIAQVIKSLEDAAAETEEVGVSRRRKRQSTFLAIHVIRDMYLREKEK